MPVGEGEEVEKGERTMRMKGHTRGTRIIALESGTELARCTCNLAKIVSLYPVRGGGQDREQSQSGRRQPAALFHWETS